MVDVIYRFLPLAKIMLGFKQAQVPLGCCCEEFLKVF